MKTRSLVAAVIAVMMTATAHAVTMSPDERRAKRKYDQIGVQEVLYGNESANDKTGRVDPPWFTANPKRVEVLQFVRHSDPTLDWSRDIAKAWEESLPEDAIVRRVGMGKGPGGKSHWLGREWDHQQRMLCAAEQLGLAAQAHELMLDMSIEEHKIARARRRLPDTQMRKDKGSEAFVKRLGVDGERWNAALGSNATEKCVGEAREMNRVRRQAGILAAGKKKMRVRAPDFVINGRYTASAAWIKDPKEVYLVANRLIREELERIKADGRSHNGPTNDEELARWLEPRSGEVFSRMRFGGRGEFKGVYSAARKEIWELDDLRKTVNVLRLTGEGDDSYWLLEAEEGTQHLNLWRRSAQFVSFLDEAGEPVRHGAFRFADWLPEAGAVRLPVYRHDVISRYRFGKNAGIEFRSDGTVVVNTVHKGDLMTRDHGTWMPGTWWIEAGALHVDAGWPGERVASSGEPRRHRMTWPWQEAAEAAGFEIPQESVTPWKVQRGRKANDPGSQSTDRGERAGGG